MVVHQGQKNRPPLVGIWNPGLQLVVRKLDRYGLLELGKPIQEALRVLHKEEV